MRDALNSTCVEDTTGFQILEWGFGPHSFHHVSSKLIEGLSHPDDIRSMACGALNRNNRYTEHYHHPHHRMMKQF